MQRILVPVDGSENALAAVRLAAGRDAGGVAIEVHLLFVRDSCFQLVPRYAARSERRKFRETEAEQALAPARELLDRFGVAHVEHVESGDKAAAIQRVAQRVQVGRIVMGAAHKLSITRMIQNSVIRELKQIASVPVEIVPGKSVSTIEKCGVPAGVGAAAALLMVAVE